MNDYILLMHDDAGDREMAGDPQRWTAYLASLRASGCFAGGSSIGAGARYRDGSFPVAVAAGVSGFLRISAASLDDAARALAGNPVFDAGGTVEIRQLTRD